MHTRQLLNYMMLSNLIGNADSDDDTALTILTASTLLNNAMRDDIRDSAPLNTIETGIMVNNMLRNNRKEEENFFACMWKYAIVCIYAIPAWLRSHTRNREGAQSKNGHTPQLILYIVYSCSGGEPIRKYTNTRINNYGNRTHWTAICPSINAYIKVRWKNAYRTEHSI